MKSNEVLVRVDKVSKKFCRSLKKSLWYGVNDIVADLLPFSKRTSNGTAQSPLRSSEFWAVNNVSFELRRSECIGLIGHNGAGKTTLLKMLNGLITPDSGRIEMRGRIGALIALGAGFNPILSGRENIYVNGAVLGLTKSQIDAKIEEIIDFAEIREFIDAPVQSYSSGMAVRLGFAIAAKTDPDVLLLDEVLAVGDVAFQAKCFNTLAEFRERGTAFILVSHNMHQISRYCDKVLYLKRGQIAHSGDRETGIDTFLRDMHQADANGSAERTDWSRVYGSGKVAFTAARFRDSEGREVNEISVGDSVTLEIDYERRGDLPHPPVLDLIMRDREGILFQGTNISEGHPFGFLNVNGHFQVQFPALPINADYVEFFFCALDKQSSEILDWKRHVRLNIRRTGASHGKLQLQTRWSAL
ncbi:MAG TPA: ABC transporter ATP-binding protein [Verrucomicrobiae bacterium]|nr:ABC transporter ATP-binding protein [Verrucomicrobiae bacterium]